MVSRRPSEVLTLTLGAARYAVVLRLSDGSTRTFKVSGRRHSLRISRVPRERSGRVDVSARGVLGDWARPNSARFKRLRAPFTVQQTRTHNERRTYLRTHHKK